MAYEGHGNRPGEDRICYDRQVNAARQRPVTSLLKEVSRSFYLTLRVLPGRVRPQIGLAYLLARASDTIADTGLVSLERRLAVLRSLRHRVAGGDPAPVPIGDLAGQQGLPAERILLERLEEALAMLAAATPSDRTAIQEVLLTIISGQELDLQRFEPVVPGKVRALASDVDLEDYTFRVAGCVGQFWTRLCRTYLFPDAPIDMKELQRKGVRFGQGLQLVNILRDLPGDLSRGRCYIPSDALQGAGLSPEDLLQPSQEPRFRPLYEDYLHRAEHYLKEGWDYTNLLPWGCVRVRLACAWPVLIGWKTLQRLHREPVLDPHHRVKVPRSEVKSIMLQTLAYYPSPKRWRRLGPILDGGDLSPERSQRGNG